MTVTEERRSSLRAPVSLLGELESGNDGQPVVLLDLSAAGARIQASDPPEVDREYLLHFTVHSLPYRARFRVAHWLEADGSYHWGGCFVDLTSEERATLRRAVNAAAGVATVWHREWSEIVVEAAGAASGQVLVGATPAGQEIRLAAADCLSMGQTGVELFVRTVAGMESA
ncbi:MAG: PilZ domain-containing protein [Chloroflexi bacterium]|nr:PilZ domain-containing protein [Chloroflexota bacterium]